jgi:uncharacterized spore protein YtfJ
MTEQENSSGVPGGGFVERLAQRLGVAVDASHVFGAPVEREGLTVIPVARAVYGFGGGGGGREGEEGEGGGAGVALTPVGFIEMGGGAARFRHFRDPLTLLPVVAAGCLATLWTLRRIRRPSRASGAS